MSSEIVQADATTIVIFGATGDLTCRKLIPALYSNRLKGRLWDRTRIVGMARRDWSNEYFREHLRKGVEEFGGPLDEKVWAEFANRLTYIRGDLEVPGDFARADEQLRALEGKPANRLYYLATAPEHYGPACDALAAAGMNVETEGWRRIVIEKPFGHDLASAEALNQRVHASFREHQIYRIDHYLGKETAQNIMFLRFANTLFEPVWNRRYISNVQITVAEEVDVGGRGGYYDQAGVVRDMFQNHLLQLLSLVAMEPPASLEANAVRNEKAKVLGNIRPIRLEDVVRGQYEGYRGAERVAADSQTATYAALKLFVDNWRWKGVPFYLRSGKSMPERMSSIIVEFQAPPDVMFGLGQNQSFTPNMLSICIQPEEGIHLRFETKVPDTIAESRSARMDFNYHEAFPNVALPDAYERLLLDALKGDASLFARSDGIEIAWALIDPVLAGWEQTPDASPLHTYKPGTWGPAASDELLARAGHVWRYGCGEEGCCLT